MSERRLMSFLSSFQTLTIMPAVRSLFSLFIHHALLVALWVMTSFVAAETPVLQAVSLSVNDLKVRAVWVSRFNWSKAEDIAPIMQQCAELGLTDVIWQVRGEATALYRSELEPLHDRLHGDNFDGDPLELAVEAAHAPGFRLHAWINTLPGGRGTTPPRDPRQLWYAQP